ncbi:hypothetical protein [Streptomyces sp. VN1]|uniref:hypothetical protein n=1 Tax=Streptomyces sp. VN1 TaxID=1821625 RepID=UPI001414F3F5|nr:hypothetical protein [Streptomyces sp. VN1]
MGVLPIDDVTGQGRRRTDLFVGGGSVLRPARTLPGGADGFMGGAARSVRYEHQQLDATQRVCGSAGRPGQELDTVGTVSPIGLLGELLDLGGEHVDVVRRQREPLLLVVANRTE